MENNVLPEVMTYPVKLSKVSALLQAFDFDKDAAIAFIDANYVSATLEAALDLEIIDQSVDFSAFLSTIKVSGARYKGVAYVNGQIVFSNQEFNDSDFKIKDQIAKAIEGLIERDAIEHSKSIMTIRSCLMFLHKLFKNNNPAVIHGLADGLSCDYDLNYGPSEFSIQLGVNGDLIGYRQVTAVGGNHQIFMPELTFKAEHSWQVVDDLALVDKCEFPSDISVLELLVYSLGDSPRTAFMVNPEHIKLVYIEDLPNGEPHYAMISATQYRAFDTRSKFEKGHEV